MSCALDFILFVLDFPMISIENAKTIDFYKTDFQFRTKYLISGLTQFIRHNCVFFTLILNWVRRFGLDKHDNVKNPRMLTEGRLTLKTLQPFLGW